MDEYPIIDLSHLLPAAQGLARLPADERIQRLRADRWIGYPRAVEALNRLEAPVCVAKQTTHAQPAAGRPDQQRQVDDRREVPPRPPGQLRRRPGAHSRCWSCRCRPSRR